MVPADEPGAFPAREWLRSKVIGKFLQFETRKQGASAGDRVYGWLFLDGENLALSCVKAGHATPKNIKYGDSEDNTPSADDTPEVAAGKAYDANLQKVFAQAQADKVGIHADAPLVRSVTMAVDNFPTLDLVKAVQKQASQGRVECIVEHVFDGGRVRCQVVDEQLPKFQYASFTLLFGGITCPRMANLRTDTPAEPFSLQARDFTQARLMQRRLPVSLIGTDKNGMNAVGIIHHPKGSISVELLKAGLARMTDWSVRLLPVGDVPVLRVAENAAKRAGAGQWHNYAPRQSTMSSSRQGTVIEVLSGDTAVILPDGIPYDSESVLQRIGLASVRAPRPGNERAGRPDEAYSVECKDRLRTLVVGKPCQYQVHYEREIPTQPGATEKRAFGSISTAKFPDVSQVLVQEGLAITQRHRDDDPRAPNYDELLAHEAAAKAAGKNMHSKKEYKRAIINDLTIATKAKANSGSLMRAGNFKAMVDFCFNGALFKLYIPTENCHIRFAPQCVRCPQSSPAPGSKSQVKAEPFGDEAKRYARTHCLQRQVEVTCTGVTNSGIVVGDMFLAPQSGSRRDYAMELLGAGLATIDQRKIDYGEVPKSLLNSQQAAKTGRMGLWKDYVEPTAPAENTPPTNGGATSTVRVRLSEICNGSSFFYQKSEDNATGVIDESMKEFTKKNGTAGAPCDVKKNKIVAALFDDGNGKSWYRAKIIEKPAPDTVGVLFIDHGNVAKVPVATHLRPLDVSLGTDKIPPVATEAALALTLARGLESDDGMDAARLLQSICWGRDLQLQTYGTDENGKIAVAIVDPDDAETTINAKLISEGLARVAKPSAARVLSRGLKDASALNSLTTSLKEAQEKARSSRAGMWRYGDVGDDDDKEI